MIVISAHLEVWYVEVECQQLISVIPFRWVVISHLADKISEFLVLDIYGYMTESRSDIEDAFSQDIQIAVPHLVHYLSGRSRHYE